MWCVPARWSRVVCILGVSCLSVGLTCLPATAQVAQDGVTAGRPTAPCFDNSNRYVNCGDGTVTDTVTGLVWLQDATCLGTVDWATGNVRASQLADGQCGLADGSLPGQWRIPTLDEWQATIARAISLGCSGEGPSNPPALTNDTGTACLDSGPTSFFGITSGSYWSVSSNEQHPNNAWAVSLDATIHGFGFFAVKTFALPAWPIRSGPALTLPPRFD